MTTTSPTAFGQFGYTLAFAERALSASLQRQLAEIGTAPETWYALKLIATRGPAVARGSLTEALNGSRSMNPERTRELVTRLEADGLIRGEDVIDLTAAGEARYRLLAEHLAGPTAELLGQFDPDDVATTIRTLQAITAAAGAAQQS